MDAGIGSTNTQPAGSSKAVYSVGNAGNEMHINIDIQRACTGAAEGNADAYAGAGAGAEDAALAPATPVPLPSGRHAATFELECIRLRQK
eukprot:1504748-Pleurochrysis_carterae.AAC.1